MREFISRSMKTSDDSRISSYTYGGGLWVNDSGQLPPEVVKFIASLPLERKKAKKNGKKSKRS